MFFLNEKFYLTKFLERERVEKIALRVQFNQIFLSDFCI